MSSLFGSGDNVVGIPVIKFSEKNTRVGIKNAEGKQEIPEKKDYIDMSDGELWYSAGLRFKCRQCGGCCTGEPGYVWITEEETAALAYALEMDPFIFEEQFTRSVGRRRSLIEYQNGDCVFFDAFQRKCRVYEHRPAQCRTWPFWNSNLHSEEDWDDAARRCPGCNHGGLISVDEIERRRKMLRV